MQCDIFNFWLTQCIQNSKKRDSKLLIVSAMIEWIQSGDGNGLFEDHLFETDYSNHVRR